MILFTVPLVQKMYLQTFNKQEIIGVFTVDSKRNLVGFNKMKKPKIQHCSKIRSKRIYIAGLSCAILLPSRANLFYPDLMFKHYQ
jgi:hypothetical protein